MSKIIIRFSVSIAKTLRFIYLRKKHDDMIFHFAPTYKSLYAFSLSELAFDITLSVIPWPFSNQNVETCMCHRKCGQIKKLTLEKMFNENKFVLMPNIYTLKRISVWITTHNTLNYSFERVEEKLLIGNIKSSLSVNFISDTVISVAVIHSMQMNIITWSMSIEHC